MIDPNPKKPPSSRTALITGAASGIGQAIATKLAESNQVVIVDRDQSAGQQAAADMGGWFIAADLSLRSDCRDAIDQARHRYGSIDILVNNAGFQHIDPIEAFDEDAWERMLAVMLTAPFLLTKHVWPDMKQNRWGRIVNISSVLGHRGAPFKSGYVAAKHGIIGLTRTTALEGGEHGITANAVCPAYVRTPLMEDQIADQARTRGIAADQVVRQVMLEPTAIKRLIEPSEIGDLVAFLCSDMAGAVTGADWAIDLGWTAQ